MTKKERIGIYGGTFSPPHIGHIGAAESFSRSVKPDRLIIMPDFLPPHKYLDGEVSALDRLEMCRIAFGHIENVEISDLEIKRGGKSYTAVTLETLKTPENELYFLCGTDMLLTLGEWYRPERIFELATVCFVRRESDAQNGELIARRVEEYTQKYGARIIPIPTNVREVSSSELRVLLKERSSVDKLIPHGVRDYILEKGLYR